ncbi:MAG: hypothetical protein Q8880_04485 [Bacteroidota bacterium]|nr:hypothetical protein [Bacteroidota bacterium]
MVKDDEIKFESESSIRAKYKLYQSISNFSAFLCLFATFSLLFISSDILTIGLLVEYILTIFILTIFWFNYNIKTKDYIILTIVVLVAVFLYSVFPKCYSFLDQDNPMINY